MKLRWLGARAAEPARAVARAAGPQSAQEFIVPFDAGDVVEVEWEDAYVEHGDLHVQADDLEPAIEFTAGYVVHDHRLREKDPCIIIAMSRHSDHVARETESEYRDVHYLPARMVNAVTLVRRH